jgi:SAM-dependent methyltransferase
MLTDTMNLEFTRPYKQVIKTKYRDIYDFPLQDDNIDKTTVESFGDEWQAFHGFEAEEMMRLGDEYFDIITPGMLNEQTKVLEVGCGSGRFLKYVSGKSNFVVGVDPSDAIFAADNLLRENKDVVLVKASANDLPFKDESFDFVYSIGVLHHIPDTLKAMQACVNKVRKGGYFFTYLYYDLDGRGFIFRSIYKVSNLLRLGICKLPKTPKRFVCDVLAVGMYMPFILGNRFLKQLGVGKNLRSKIPLYGYENKSFYIIRNDSLDRFGTPLEQRFTKQQIQEMMASCGLSQISFSNNIPFWHVVGKKC